MLGVGQDETLLSNVRHWLPYPYWEMQMARGSYLGGSTIIGPGSNWFGRGNDKKSNGKSKGKKVKNNRMKPVQDEGLPAKRQSPDIVEKRLNRNMRGVQVYIRLENGNLVKQSRD